MYRWLDFGTWKGHVQIDRYGYEGPLQSYN